KVEVETETKEQVLEAVEAAADIIMFDNQSPEEMKKLLELVPEFITTEASGGIQMENLASYQNTGVDYISLGFLTHSYQALDMSMKVIIKIKNMKEDDDDGTYRTSKSVGKGN